MTLKRTEEQKQPEVTKEILLQYGDLQEEVKEIRHNIQSRKDQLENMINNRDQVSDSVKGTRPDGTYGNIMITGFPTRTYERRKCALQAQVLLLEEREADLLEMQSLAEKYIAGIPRSGIRRIFRMYFIEGQSLTEIGRIMGYDRSTIGKKISDFMSEN